jgi:hypothetical protein
MPLQFGWYVSHVCPDWHLSQPFSLGSMMLTRSTISGMICPSGSLSRLVNVTAERPAVSTTGIGKTSSCSYSQIDLTNDLPVTASMAGTTTWTIASTMSAISASPAPATATPRLLARLIAPYRSAFASAAASHTLIVRSVKSPLIDPQFVTEPVTPPVRKPNASPKSFWQRISLLLAPGYVHCHV